MGVVADGDASWTLQQGLEGEVDRQAGHEGAHSEVVADTVTRVAVISVGLPRRVLNTSRDASRHLLGVTDRGCTRKRSPHLVLVYSP